MNVSYLIIVLFVVLLALIWFLIRKRNRRDRAELEDQLKRIRKKAERHDSPHV